MTHKTTVYLPDDLRDALRREAAMRGRSEAQVIREALAEAVGRPRPRAGLLSAAPISHRTEELLGGFGER